MHCPHFTVFQWCRRNATWIQTSPVSLPLKQQQLPPKLTTKIRFVFLIPRKHWFSQERVRSFLQGMARAMDGYWLRLYLAPSLTSCFVSHAVISSHLAVNFELSQLRINVQKVSKAWWINTSISEGLYLGFKLWLWTKRSLERKQVPS